MNIAAVIVTFNRKEMLTTVIDSVQKNKVDHIYIIDNNSSDGTQEYIFKNILNKDNQNKITYTKLKENTGGAGGFYSGVKLAYETKEHDWLWLMDDDICPRENTLDEYKKCIIANKEVGAVLGIRLYKNSPFLFESKENDFSNYRKMINHNTVTLDDVNNSDYFEVANFPFEGPLINCRIIEKIGYPNPEFFIRGDDSDYAIRIKKHAEIFMVSGAKLDKLISPYSSNKYEFTWKNYYAIRNTVYLNKLYGENISVKYLRNLKLLFSVFKCNTVSIVKNREFKNIKLYKKIYISFYHGMTGKLGKTYLPGDF